MLISKRVFFPRYVVLTSIVWLLVAVCPVLHGTQYSTLVLFSPHALFLDDIINYYSFKCHLYDDGSQLYAVLVPSTSLNSRIKSPTTQMDISIWMSHRYLRFVMSQTRILYLFFSTATNLFCAILLPITWMSSSLKWNTDSIFALLYLILMAKWSFKM